MYDFQFLLKLVVGIKLDFWTRNAFGYFMHVWLVIYYGPPRDTEGQVGLPGPYGQPNRPDPGLKVEDTPLCQAVYQHQNKRRKSYGTRK